METASKTLPESVEALKKLLLSERDLAAQMTVQKNAELKKNETELKKKDAEIIQLKQQYQHMLEQFRLAQKKQFGKSSETSADQLHLFNEAEQIVEEEASPSSADAQPPVRQKPKRKPLPKDLPRETVLHDLAEEDKVCDCCGGQLHQMGCDTSEQLEFIPATIKVIEHVRPKYSCRSCEKQGTQMDIKMAPVAASPIPKSMATPSLLSQIITSKYQYALPLYRQESLFKQYGIDLNRKTMASWMLQINPLLQTLYERMHAIQLQQGVIHADETPLKVIHEDKHTCYMWVYCTGTDSPGPDNDPHKPPNMVLYDYQNSRAGRCAQDYLRQFKGYLQVDGYAGYDKAEATLVGCWAHARRKFIEAKTVQVKGKTGKADWAINHIQKLYRIETAIKDKTPEEKQAIRQQQSHPLLAQFKAWLDKSALHVPPKSAIGKAIAYSLRQWPKLNQYIENGNLSIDNNRAERAIKPFVIGRKNWLFANTAKGAQASAVLYSIIETAKANGLIPFDYLKYLLEELPGNPDDIDYLLPWNVALTEK